LVTAVLAGFAEPSLYQHTPILASRCSLCVSLEAVGAAAVEHRPPAVIPDLDATILCCCNAYNRGALSADTLQRQVHRGGLEGLSRARLIQPA
jgi:hypothetical protein